MKQFKNSKIQQLSQKGFTLIELLTSVAVIGIVSALVLVNLNTGKKQKDIQRAAQKLMLDIRRAQNMSLSPGAANVCVYGLKANSASDYSIYHNDGSCPVAGYSFGAGSVAQENISIGNNIQMSFSGNMDVAFEAPEPITYINGATTAPFIEVVLSNASCPACAARKVVVNRLGLVEMQ